MASGKFTGVALISVSILLLAYVFHTVSTHRKDSFDSSVSVAISQYDIASGVDSAKHAAARYAATVGAAAVAAAGGSAASRFVVYVAVGASLVLGILGIALVTGNALRTAQRVEVNATQPFASFDSVVYSGADFTHVNHRGRRLGRVDSSR